MSGRLNTEKDAGRKSEESGNSARRSSALSMNRAGLDRSTLGGVSERPLPAALLLRCVLLRHMISFKPPVPEACWLHASPMHPQRSSLRWGFAIVFCSGISSPREVVIAGPLQKLRNGVKFYAIIISQLCQAAIPTILKRIKARGSLT